MFGLLDYLKIGVGFAAGLLVAFLPAFALGKYEGRHLERQAVIQRSIQAYQKRERIDHDVSGLDAVRLCLELGGLPEQCEQLRRLGEAAESE